MILLIDNYDSFTYNLLQYMQEVSGREVVVYRNDRISLAEIESLAPQHIVLSPGPCTPDESGICMPLIREFYTKIPILGVCLGHQAIAQAFGGKVIRAAEVMHGKTSEIIHSENGLFSNLRNPFVAARYHSLIVERDSLPSEFEITAWTKDRTIMAIEHREVAHLVGLQFHPESIVTGVGKELLARFLSLAPNTQSKKDQEK